MPAPRPRLSKFGAYNEPKYTKYKKDARLFCMGIKVSDRPIHIKLEFVFEKPKSWSRLKKDSTVWHTVKPDIDNLEKSALDFLNGIVYIDDSQVCVIESKKVYGVEGTNIEIIYL